MAVICYLLQDESKRFGKDINANICAVLHPRFRCKFWDKDFGTVPKAVLMTPFNNEALLEGLLVWPPEPEPEPKSGEALMRSAHVAWRAPR